MPPRRRKTAAPKGPAGPTSRVHALESLAQWEAMLAKAAKSRRIVVIQFYQANNYASAQMRTYFKKMSGEAGMKGAVFAEVEVDAAEEELLDACGVQQGVTRIPHYCCFAGDEQVENYSGGQPQAVIDMVKRQMAALGERPGGLLGKLLLAAGGAAALAGGLYWHLVLNKGSGGSSGGHSTDLGQELKRVNERIRIAQQRKRNCERAGKLKGAKNQSRLLRQLEGQRRAAEAKLQSRQQPSEKGAAAGAAAAEAEGRRSGGGGRKKGRGPKHDPSSPLPRGIAAAQDSSDDESGTGSRRRRRPAPALLYSDEE